MKISYDKEVDAPYIRILDETPEAAIIVAEGIHIDLTKDKRIVGIEILDASEKLPLETLYKLEFDHDMVEAEW